MRPAFTIGIPTLNGARLPVYTDKAAAEAWRKRHDPEGDTARALVSADACAFRIVGADGGHSWALYVPPDASRERIGHECLHAAWFLLDSHGITVDVYNHEALAYLQEYLAVRTAAGLARLQA